MNIRRAEALLAIPAFAQSLWAMPAEAAKFPTKLFLSQDGIALSHVPHRDELKHTIQVDRTKGKTAANWTAISDQPWLSVTSSGVTGGTLTVQADPTGLTNEQFYPANVTVSTNGADFTDSETLHVGLWVSREVPGTVEVQQNVASVATNPVLPIAYVSDGGSSVVEYNVYSGNPVGTFTKVAPTIGDMEVSSDGATLFVADTTNDKIVAVDASTGAALGEYDVGSTLSNGRNMVYARLYGQPALYPSGGQIIAYPSGETLLGAKLPDAALAATPDGRRLFAVTIGGSPGQLSRHSLKLVHGTLRMDDNGTTPIEGENCQDLAVSLDGKHVYPACGWPYQFDVYDDRTLQQVQTLAADHYPNNIEVDRNNHVVGGLNGIYDPNDVFVYSQNGYLLGSVATTDITYYGQDTRTMKISGDATRVVTSLTGYLIFRTLP